MRVTLEPPPEADDLDPSLSRRLAWFGGLALAVILGAAGVAYLLKALLQ